MKAAPFAYARAGSVDEACALLAEHGDGAKLVAGGQSLVPMMAMRLVRPALLIDINEIGALKFIRRSDDGVQIGACTRQCVLERDADALTAVPLLGQALAWVGHVQTRNRGTVGGSLAHADPSAELPLCAVVLDAELQLRSRDGRRTAPARAFFQGPMMTALAADELLEAIQWPAWDEPRVGAAFMEMSVRHGDFAIVAAAAQVALDDAGRCVRASFGVGGADATPRAFPELVAHLLGTGLEDALVQDVAGQAAARLEPGSDLHASAAYRRHLARVLAQQALAQARERARTGKGTA